MHRKKFLSAVFLFLILSTANTVFGFGQDNIAMHGFASQGYLISSDNKYLGNSDDGSFEYNEIGINFSILINDGLRFGIQFFSRDLGNYGNNELGIDWAFLDYAWRDWLGFRAGKIKMPFGLYNRRRDTDMLRTSILMPQSVYNEGFRDMVVAFHGFSLYGNKTLGAFGYIDYELFGGILDIPPNTPFFVEYISSLEYTNPSLYDIVELFGPENLEIILVTKHIEGGMLVWNTPLTGFRLGVMDVLADYDYSLSTMNTKLHLNECSVISAEYDIGNVTISAERFKVAMDIDIPGILDDFGVDEMSLNMEGYYGAISWNILKWMTIGVAYGEYFPNADNKDGSEIQGGPDYYAWQKDITVSTRFNVNEYWCFKFETHFYDGVGGTMLEENPPEDSEQNWILYLFKTSLSF